MFEKLAKKFQTGILVLLVTLLSLVFVLQFGGPQAEGCTAGGATYAAKVDGTVITDGDFEAAYALAGFDRQPTEVQKRSQLKERTLDGLVERTLLARKASELGFRVSEEDVMKRLAKDDTILLSLGVDTPVSFSQTFFMQRGADVNAPLAQAAVPVGLKDREGDFDEERAKLFIQNRLQRSITEFAEAQVQETLAHRLRETLRSTVSVSPRELWDEYVQKNNKARIEYVRFSPRFYRSQVEVTDANIQRWMNDNADALAEEYEANEHKYTGLDKQARARHIELRVPAGASEDEKSKLRRKAEGIVQQARGGTPFAQLAEKHSDDQTTAGRGGDLGWNPKGRIPAPHDEVVFELEEGEVSDVVESGGSLHVFKAEGFREGDVPEREAKREIAERLYREERTAELARQAAKATLAKMRSGTSGDALDEWLRERRGDGSASQDGSGNGDGSDEGGEDDPLAPTVKDSGEFGPGAEPITGVDSGPLVNEVFSELSEDDPLPEEPIQLGSDFVAFKLVERQRASREDFTDEERRKLLQRLLPQKQREVVRLYVHRLRDAAQAEGAIRINAQTLEYGGQADDGKQAPRPMPGQF